MNWIDDIAGERRRQAETEEEATRLLIAEADRVNPMVSRLLEEVGAAYWGPFQKHFRVKRYGDPVSHRSGPFWEVQSGGTDWHSYWRVSLILESGNMFCFKVVGVGFDTLTKDTSEAALQAALRHAVKSGPLFWESDKES